MKRIAVLMTCHNRREKTLACLDRLFSQEDMRDIQLGVYLVDDGCVDATEEAVAERFPSVKILHGDGHFYWSGGMRLAFDVASKENYDYYLWLNDDTLLYPHALKTLVQTAQVLHRKLGRDAIVAGSMQDSQTKWFTYGGSRKKNKVFPLSFVPVEPSDKPQLCDVVNGNCVLISRGVAIAVGNICSGFTHGLGDYDFSLRARLKGITSWITAGYLGICSRNSLKESSRDKALPVRDRIKKLSEKTDFPPVAEYKLFARRHGGLLWPYYWARTSVRMLFPWLWVVWRARKVN